MSFISALFLIVILSVSVMTAFVSVTPIAESNFASLTIQRLETLKTAVNTYETHNSGTGPASLTNLITTTGTACTVDTNIASGTYKKLRGWCGPYIDRPLQQDPDSYRTDAWGTLIQYSSTQLRSCGPNRVCNDGDDLVLAH